MEQQVPNINDDDIKQIIDRDFPQLEFTAVLKILMEYKSESAKGYNRVYASILKLSDGNIELVQKYVEKAKWDYRDVIALAEYPNYSKYAFDDGLTYEKKVILIKDDWIQYERWLNS
jgi:hypothetical protein